MNIVYVHEHFSTPRGSTGTRSYDFARLLLERGHRVTVVTGVYGPSDLSRLDLPRLVNRRTIDGIDVRIINVRHDNRQPFWRRLWAFAAFMLLATLEVPVRTDPSHFKPVDVPSIVGDATRLRDAVGWRPRILWRQSLADTWSALGAAESPESGEGA